MTLVGDDYCELIAEHLSPRTPKIPFYSSVRAKVLRESSDFGPRYWQDNLESPVLFHSATRALLAGSKECAVHLEVGPHAALAGPLRQIYKETSQKINYVSVLSRSKDDTVSFCRPWVSYTLLEPRYLTQPAPKRFSPIFQAILGTMRRATGPKPEFRRIGDFENTSHTIFSAFASSKEVMLHLRGEMCCGLSMSRGSMIIALGTILSFLRQVILQ